MGATIERKDFVAENSSKYFQIKWLNKKNKSIRININVAE